MSRAAPAMALQVTLARRGAAVARLADHFQSDRFEASLALPQAEAWSPEAPNLYDLVIELIVDDKIVEFARENCGSRRFEAKDGRLMLNGEPFYMFGALDQDGIPRRSVGAER